MIDFLNAAFNGISIGAVLLLAALGLAIVFGLMGVINLAHGELMMLGAYATYVVQNGFKAIGDGWWNEIYIFVALFAAFLVAALAGLILERGVVRFLYGRPLETLLATWGVSLILRQFVRSANWAIVAGIILFCGLYFGGAWLLRRRPNWDSIKNWASPVLLVLSIAISSTLLAVLGGTESPFWTREWFGSRNVDVTAPAWLRGGFPFGNYQLPYARIFIIILTALCVAGIYWFLQKTKWGLRVRSVTQNRDMSACLGIPTQKVDALTFSLGSGLAGIAGCAITLLGSVGPNVGGNYIVDAFMVVVLGGVGKLVGTIVAAMAIGMLNYLIGAGTIAFLLQPVEPLANFFLFFSTTSMAKVMVFALIIAFLQVRPAGMFPQKGRSVEG